MENELRTVRKLNKGWKFFYEGPENDISFPDLPDRSAEDWEEVTVPHDWAVEGPFDREHDLQKLEIFEDGVKKEKNHTGRTGGLPTAGTGWYYRELKVPRKVVENSQNRVYLEFDGIMSNSTVFVNGQQVGGRPYGYSSFALEISKQLKKEGSQELLIKAAPEFLSSRWYPGAGLYREVRLMIHGPLHVNRNGVYPAVVEISNSRARLETRLEIKNNLQQPQKINIKTIILDDKQRPAAETKIGDQKIETGVHVLTLNQEIKNPVRWDIDNPHLYKMIVLLEKKGEPVDRYDVNFGVRQTEFEARKGFFLNGSRVKLKGVCLHHDNGPLGAAVYKRALKRKLQKLKDMGCNAVRTSHNPPSPELLELCDELGFLVIDEAFDEWNSGKLKNGYHKYFQKWARKDLRDMVKRDRCHPSVIMWSIGNEIREQGEKEGRETAQFLTDICRRHDPHRPVTAGFNQASEAMKNGLAEVVDIVGWNYECSSYEKYHAEHPDWIMYGSETESTLSSRGVYFFPAEERKEPQKHSSLQMSSYDLEATSWGYIPDREFKAQEECPYMLGEFVWTGFDYLGEPTPYYSEWPSRSSYFGIFDLCGLPKDRYYLYRSHWTDKPTLHLLPHWNWPGKEGEKVPVFCYTGYPEVELFLNGRSLGSRKKDSSGLLSRYRLMWEDVVYEPGTLRAIAYDQEGQKMAEAKKETSGPPAKVTLAPERAVINGSREELGYIQFQIKDEQSNLCPRADSRVTFRVQGPARIKAVGNGNPATTEPFISDSRKAFRGRGVLIIQATGKQGVIKISAEARGLTSGQTEVLSLKL